MDLELLRTFLEVNRTRHFARSAELLNITQAAVSNRVKTLETFLKVRLFDRTTRDIRLTPEGARLVRHADRVIAAWRAARQDVSSTQSNSQLALGGSARLWDTLMQPWLVAIRTRYPDLAIIAESQPPEVLSRKLVDGNLDVAVMLEPAQLDILQIKEVGSIDVIFVSTSPGVATETALGDGFVYVDWGLSHGLEHRRAFPDAPEALTRVSRANIALELLLALGGAAYLPYTMVAEHLQTSRLYRVEDAPSFERTAYAAYLVRSARSELIESCIDFIVPPTELP